MDNISSQTPIVIWQKEPEPAPAPSPYDCGGSDCACAKHSMTPIQQVTDYYSLHFENVRLIQSPSCKIVPIDEEYNIVLGKSSRPVVLNNKALSVLCLFKTPRTLTEVNDRSTLELQDTFSRFLELGLISPVNTELLSGNQESILIAWLHTSDRCNLRCTYCYLAHLPQDMSLDIGIKAIDATFRSAYHHGFAKVQLKYAGGEPLLRFPFLVKLHEYALQLASQADIELDGVVLSNGTLLTKPIVQAIQSLNLRLMVSLDGLGRLHDIQRPYAGGHGTADDVTRGVDLALSLGLRPFISITVSGQSANGLPELIKWVLARGLSFNLNFYRANEHSANHSELNVEEDKIIDAMLKTFQIIEANLPNTSLLDSLVDLSDLSGAHEKTCGVGENYLVFDQHGRISKCQMHQTHIVADINSADPLKLIRADQLGIRNLKVNEKEGCKTCDWKYWCAGGCPLLTFRATGRYDLNSPNCNIYKKLYPAAARLEGLRLLKYYGSQAA